MQINLHCEKEKNRRNVLVSFFNIDFYALFAYSLLITKTWNNNLKGIRAHATAWCSPAQRAVLKAYILIGLFGRIGALYNIYNAEFSAYKFLHCAFTLTAQWNCNELRIVRYSSNMITPSANPCAGNSILHLRENELVIKIFCYK